MNKIVAAVAMITVAAGGVWLWQSNRVTSEDAARNTAAGKPEVGSKAPMFKTTGALAGKPFELDLASQLEKGPLVLYFFPKVFTEGCTLEAREFAERSDDFAALGASVVGMSADSVEELARFSEQECRDKFVVAQATPAIMDAYDVKLPAVAMTDRTSFVIARDGRITLIHSEMDYRDHVRLTYEAVEKLAGKGPTAS